MPSRKTKMNWVSTTSSDPNRPAAEGEHLGLASPVDLEGEDVRIDTEHAIDQLDHQDQEIIRLHAQGHLDEEIAKELGVTRQAVNRRRLKALARLREMLGG
jgi:RNA polymerase sigma factor (sigma-70 family)